MSEPEEKKWAYLLPAALFGWLAIYMLVTGELPVDKRRTVILTRSGDPIVYWTILLVSGTMAVLCLRKVWRWITGK